MLLKVLFSVIFMVSNNLHLLFMLGEKGKILGVKIIVLLEYVTIRK